MNKKNLHVRLSTRNLHPEDAIRSGVVELGVLELVVALNGMEGVSTMASCEGHAEPRILFRRPLMESKPYVLFRSPVEYARKLSKSIEGDGLGNCLHYRWHLRGYFHPLDDELVWFVEPFDTRLKAKWDRTGVNADLAALADIVKQVSTSLTSWEA